jgi:hypothetical protein
MVPGVVGCASRRKQVSFGGALLEEKCVSATLTNFFADRALPRRKGVLAALPEAEDQREAVEGEQSPDDAGADNLRE